MRAGRRALLCRGGGAYVRLAERHCGIPVCIPLRVRRSFGPARPPLPWTPRSTLQDDADDDILRQVQALQQRQQLVRPVAGGGLSACSLPSVAVCVPEPTPTLEPRAGCCHAR